MTDRPSWDETFRDLTLVWARRSTCSRRQVGAIVVKDKMVLGQGYNGVASGKTHCIDGGCPRGQHYGVSAVTIPGVTVPFHRCACGNIWPCPESAKPGDDYNLFPCRALHAELNALAYAGLEACEGATLYVNAEPCGQCAALIERFKIKKVVIVK